MAGPHDFSRTADEKTFAVRTEQKRRVCVTYAAFEGRWVCMKSNMGKTHRSRYCSLTESLPPRILRRNKSIPSKGVDYNGRYISAYSMHADELLLFTRVRAHNRRHVTETNKILVPNDYLLESLRQHRFHLLVQVPHPRVQVTAAGEGHAVHHFLRIPKIQSATMALAQGFKSRQHYTRNKKQIESTKA